ncbi:hypothetical protein GYB22_12620 [bacterium]|nr:hypothetical protein [bacterium]
MTILGSYLRISRIRFLLLTFALAFVALEACKDKGEDGPKFAEFYKAISDVWFQIDRDSTINRGFDINEEDSTFYGDYGYYLGIDFITYKEPIARSFTLLPGVYADDPVISQPQSKERILDIQISSNADYDSDHPAGTDLSDLFYIEVLSDLHGEPTFEREAISKYTTGDQPPFREALFYLNKAPETEGFHQFTITYIQDGIDIDTFEHTGPLHFIKK